jgi:hypothetical protein
MHAVPLEPMPASVEEEIGAVLEPGEDLRVSVGTDIDPEGRFQGTWLIATHRRLVIIAPAPKPPAESQTASHQKPRKGSRQRSLPGRGRTSRRLPLSQVSAPERSLPEAELKAADLGTLTVLQIPVETVAAVKAHDYVGSGVLEATLVDPEGAEPVGTIELLRYSRSLSDKFGQLAANLEGLLAEHRTVEPQSVSGDGDQAAAGRSNDTPPTPDRERDPMEERSRCPQCGRPLPKGSDVCPHCIDRRAVMLRLLGSLRPYTWKAVLSLGLAMALTAASLRRPC